MDTFIPPGIQAYKFSYSDGVGLLEISCTSLQAQMIRDLISLIDWQDVYEAAIRADEAANRAP